MIKIFNIYIVRKKEMSTLEDQVLALTASVNALSTAVAAIPAAQPPVDLSPVLTKLDQVLAQFQASPAAPAPAAG